MVFHRGIFFVTVCYIWRGFDFSRVWPKRIIGTIKECEDICVNSRSDFRITDHGISLSVAFVVYQIVRLDSEHLIGQFLVQCPIFCLRMAIFGKQVLLRFPTLCLSVYLCDNPGRSGTAQLLVWWICKDLFRSMVCFFFDAKIGPLLVVRFWCGSNSSSWIAQKP